MGESGGCIYKSKGSMALAPPTESDSLNEWGLVNEQRSLVKWDSVNEYDLLGECGLLNNFPSHGEWYSVIGVGRGTFVEQSRTRTSIRACVTLW